MSNQATESTIASRWRDFAKAAAVAVIVLLLLSSCAISFWPLGDTEAESPPQGVDRTRAAGAILVEDVSVLEADGLEIGPKGTPIVVTCFITSRAEDVVFDPAFLSLEFDSVSLPPMTLAADESASWVSYPSVLKAGEREVVSAAFASPLGSEEATFVVQFPDMGASDAVAVHTVFGNTATQ